MCNQTQDTDRLESNRQMYCLNVNEQRKQVSKCRYNLLPGYERSWDDGVCLSLTTHYTCRLTPHIRQAFHYVNLHIIFIYNTSISLCVITCVL